MNSERESTALVGYERQGPTAHLVLRRPEKHNALTAAMMGELLAGVERAAADDDVRAIVIRGEGPAFCAGFDIADPADFHGGDHERLRDRIAGIETKADWMRRLILSPKPLIVAAHGACIGIGTYVVLVADFAIATTDAGFGLPEERFGSAGATWAYPFLIREVGLKRANEIVMTGRRYAAEEFACLGLLNRVVEPEALAGAVEGLGAALASLPRDGIALNRAVKSLSLAAIGHLDAFTVHAATHPLAERLGREDDEFDFMAVVEKRGMRVAIAEREEHFGGDWWGW